MPLPNSLLFFNCLCLGAHFSQEGRLTTEGFIVALVATVYAVAMATGLVKNKVKKWFLFI